jgi:ATP-binding cassette subfamily B (MDR/TAP) protein 1
VQVLQVGKCIQLMSTFIGGFIIAFVRGWLLTIVLCSSIPLIVLSGAMMALVISKMASRGQSSYAKAANVVEQTIGGIKTVGQFVKIKYF